MSNGMNMIKIILNSKNESYVWWTGFNSCRMHGDLWSTKHLDWKGNIKKANSADTEWRYKQTMINHNANRIMKQLMKRSHPNLCESLSVITRILFNLMALYIEMHYPAETANSPSVVLEGGGFGHFSKDSTLVRRWDDNLQGYREKLRGQYLLYMLLEAVS